MALHAGCSETKRPQPEVIDPRVISATLAERRQWVTEQAQGPGALHFSREYEDLLAAAPIGPKEATQLAYLFLYSTGTMGGFFENPVREGVAFKFNFHPELGPGGNPVFVDPKTGFAWQEGQNERVDMLALIHLFTNRRMGGNEEQSPWPLFPLHFAALWLTIGFVLSRMGWSQFARKYRSSLRPAGRSFNCRSVWFGTMFGTYSNSVRVVFSDAGIYVYPVILFRMFHPPFLVPWTKVVGVARKRRGFLAGHEFEVRDGSSEIHLLVGGEALRESQRFRTD